MANGRSSDFKKILDSPQPYNEFKSEDFSQLLKDSERNPTLARFQGSLVGLAIGDALGAPVEFKPNSFLAAHPVRDMQSGGTWGLKEGYWTDDTSMALCLAASLIIMGKNSPRDQMQRYTKWYKKGYLSSTGKCFDIGNGTRISIEEFDSRSRSGSNWDDSDLLSGLGPTDAAGNGCLMRIAPLALFYSNGMAKEVLEHSQLSTVVTHGDRRAIDACKYFSFLVCSAVQGVEKEKLLDPNFFRDSCHVTLHDDVESIIAGSYKIKKNGYEDGIRAKGFVLNTLEAALWAFHHDEGSFERGVLLAVNLGDDTDTVAAVYGQLAGACYGLKGIPERWHSKLFQYDFIRAVAIHLSHNRFKADEKNSQQNN